MITEFQKKKLSHFFNILDSQKKGYLQIDNFSDIVENIRISFGYTPEDKKYKFLAEKSTRFFHKLLNSAIHADPQSISEQEWIDHIETEIIDGGNEDLFDDFAEFIIGFLFDMFDDDHDGYISTDEFVDMFIVYGIDIRYSAKAFLNLDVTKDGRLSKNELIHAFETFLLSDDPQEPGNWIFGTWD